MTNSDRFLESILNQTHLVYGLKLKPLTLFHVAYLEHIESPLMSGGEIKEEDLFKAAVVCSSESQEELTRKFNNLFLPFLLPFYKVGREFEKWNNYFADYMSLPQFWEGDGKKAELPFCLTCAAAVIKITGWSFDQVFYRTPLGKILWLNQAFQYLETGKTSIKTDEELSIIAHLESLKGVN